MHLETHMHTKQAERRRAQRMDLACPITVANDEHGLQIAGRTLDVSDSGAMISIPVKMLPKLKEKLQVKLSVPRTTPNTRMLEQFVSPATVVRHQPLVDDNYIGMAIRFAKPMGLGLKV